MITILTVIIRIISNSLSNVYQKQLTTEGYKPSFINFIMYSGLTILLLPIILKIDYNLISYEIWIYAILGGLFGALGNSYLVKALQNGELSVLGPINAYKSVVAMLAGIFLLGEIPSWHGISAIILIIIGSYVIFDTQEEGFSIKLLTRCDIRYRIYALVFTAIEAIFIKKVIKSSDILTSLIMWSFFGMLFTGIRVFYEKNYCVKYSKPIILKLFGIIALMGIMQYSTNYVFSHMQVSYCLALFQLSALISVIFGWKYFNEKNVLQKLLGSTIMIIGAAILIIF